MDSGSLLGALREECSAFTFFFAFCDDRFFRGIPED
jgi:hypothetical protein